MAFTGIRTSGKVSGNNIRTQRPERVHEVLAAGDSRDTPTRDGTAEGCLHEAPPAGALSELSQFVIIRTQPNHPVYATMERDGKQYRMVAATLDTVDRTRVDVTYKEIKDA